MVIVASAMACLGPVAGAFSLFQGTLRVVSSWRVGPQLCAVVSMVTLTSRVAGLLPGDQGTRFGLVDGLREGKGERRHQGA